jgi:hypothetical protein
MGILGILARIGLHNIDKWVKSPDITAHKSTYIGDVLWRPRSR